MVNSFAINSLFRGDGGSDNLSGWVRRCCLPNEGLNMWLGSGTENSVQRRPRSRGLRAAVALLATLFFAAVTVQAEVGRGSQFIGLTDFSRFYKFYGPQTGEMMWISPEIASTIHWNELILSWNADAPTNSYIRFEVRAFYRARASRYYTIALWTPTPGKHPRASIPNQRDEQGKVDTDTLVLDQPCDRLQLRITLGGPPAEKPIIKFLGLSLLNSEIAPARLTPNRLAWGKMLEVPERSQMNYPNGNVLCSPTAVSMMLSYWAERRHRPSWDRDVPEVASGVYDSNWKGTGNWAFNTAYAGSIKGLRACVTRFSDISEIESWIVDGYPVVLSLCYDRLRAKGPGPNGHLVVCVGFTENGDPIINDPGTRDNVRKVFPRKNLERAWAYSKNTVYLIYPEEAKVPQDRYGHWPSWSSKLRSGFADGMRPEYRRSY